MKPIASSPLFRAALLGGIAIGCLSGLAVQALAEVGVAAAVNVDAKGRPPGGGPRVISLGSSIVFNEEVTTDAAGLVQILLLDGTTFTVGPNSQLTIDEFVYNPDTGDAKVVASLTKGVFRFVGARTSQTEGGATVKTPVGTIGIRGAVTNISYDPATGQSTAALVAGNKLTITDGGGTQRIVYETGFTAVITKDAGGGATTTVRKSTPAETRAFQQQLAGKSGQSGGTSDPPDDQKVASSKVGENNSGLPNIMDVPGSQRPPTNDDLDDKAGIDGKTQDDLDNDIAEQEQEQTARLLTAPDEYVPGAYEDDPYPNPGQRGLVGSTPESDRIVTLTRQGGRLLTTDGVTLLNLPDFSGSQGNGPIDEDYEIAPLEVCDSGCEAAASLGGNSLTGVAYAGRGDFVAYLLGIDDLESSEDNPAFRPVYVIYGTPASINAQNSMATGDNIREYTLTVDPIQNIPVPFFNNDLYAGGFAPGTYNSSNLFVIEPANSETADVRGFQSWISIEGTGAGQKSAAFVNTSNIYRESGDEPLQLGSRRTGSFRYAADDGATNMRGGVATLPGATGDHFFGQNADHFVIGTSANPADTFFDSHHGSGFSDPYAEGYLNDARFATHHVGSLIDISPQGDFSRDNGGDDGRLDGFMAGMGETDYFGNTYRLTSGDQGPNMYASFNAVDNAFAARGTVYDYNGDDDEYYNEADRLGSILLTFGHYNEGETEYFGQGTYVDDTYYGADANGDLTQTVVTTDDDTPHTDNDQYAAGSYIVSGRANPIEGYQHLASANPDPAYSCADCDFIQWGWWGTRTQTDLDPGEDENIRTDYVHMGTWVAGEISTEEEIYGPPGDPYAELNMPFGGNATYKGTALGTVNDDGSQYIASGNVKLEYSFAQRYGDFSLSLDGMSAAGRVFDDNSAGLFAGTLDDYGLGDGSSTGTVNGAFVNNGPNVIAAGMIGDFTLQNYDQGKTAVGTFAGAGASGPGPGPIN